MLRLKIATSSIPGNDDAISFITRTNPSAYVLTSMCLSDNLEKWQTKRAYGHFMEFEPEVKRVSVNTRLVLTGPQGQSEYKSSLDERCSPEGARVTGTERDTRTPFVLGDDVN